MAIMSFDGTMMDTQEDVKTDCMKKLKEIVENIQTIYTKEGGGEYTLNNMSKLQTHLHIEVIRELIDTGYGEGVSEGDEFNEILNRYVWERNEGLEELDELKNKLRNGIETLKNDIVELLEKQK